MLYFLLTFIVYMMVRNFLVHREMLRMISFYYLESEHKGSALNMDNVMPSYEEMLFRFWVWPLSGFYSAYHNRKR